MNTDLIGKYYLGAGGIGDFLLTLSTFYDNVEEANIIFLANNTNQIKEIANLFPKLKKKLILENDFNLLSNFFIDKNCLGTGILPKDLNYNNWYRVDVVKEYNVILYPHFICELFLPKKVFDTQIFIQRNGSNAENTNGKRRILLDKTITSAYKEFDLSYEFLSLESFKNMSYKDIFEIILGSDIVIGCDSFVKSFAALAGKRVIVYDNIYTEEYLNNFKDKRDYGHYVFIDPWKNIELRKQ